MLTDRHNAGMYIVQYMQLQQTHYNITNSYSIAVGGTCPKLALQQSGHLGTADRGQVTEVT